MKPSKFLKLFLLLFMFSICPINAMENQASFEKLSHSTGKRKEKERKERETEEKREREKREDQELLKNYNEHEESFILYHSVGIRLTHSLIIKLHNASNIPTYHYHFEYNCSFKGPTLLAAIAIDSSPERLCYIIDHWDSAKKAINVKSNFLNDQGTPLHITHHTNNFDCFVALLEKEADFTIKNDNGKTCAEVGSGDEVSCYGYGGRDTYNIIKNGKNFQVFRIALRISRNIKYIAAVNYYKIWRIKNKIKRAEELEKLINSTDQNFMSEKNLQRLSSQKEITEEELDKHINTIKQNNRTKINKLTYYYIAKMFKHEEELKILNKYYTEELTFIYLNEMGINYEDIYKSIFHYTNNFNNFEILCKIYRKTDKKGNSTIFRKNLFKYYHLKDIERRIDSGYKSSYHRKNFGVIGNEIMRKTIIQYINPADFPAGIPLKKNE